MARLDPAISLEKAQPCHIIGIAGSSPAMTAGVPVSSDMLLPPVIPGAAAKRRTRNPESLQSLNRPFWIPGSR
jgi:hypothetical protein